MSTADSTLQQRVLEELRWEPAIDAAHIGVAVSGQVVTLTGTVPSYYQKTAAERAAARVAGVHALATDIEVVFTGEHRLDDTEIAGEVLAGLRRSTVIPHEGVDVTVGHGVVTLRGGVEWRYQRDAAEDIARDLPGVINVVNLIAIQPKPSGKLLEEHIESAFRRNAMLDAQHIEIDTDNGTITLRGTVHSLQEQREAERAAWATPGVREVANHLVVRT